MRSDDKIRADIEWVDRVAAEVPRLLARTEALEAERDEARRVLNERMEGSRAEIQDLRAALAESVAREQRLAQEILSLANEHAEHYGADDQRFRDGLMHCWAMVSRIAAVPSPAVTPEPRPAPTLRDVPRLPATAALDHCGTCHRPLPHNEVESHACPTVPVETTEDR